MSTAYYRVKKCRDLKRSAKEIILSSNASDAKQCRFDDSNSYVSDDEDSSFDLTNRAPDFSSSNSQSSPSSLSSQQSWTSEESSQENGNDDSTVTVVSFPEKLQNWCVRFRNSLTVEAIEVLLVHLRDENLPNLPKSAATLLQTKSNPNVKSMKCFKNTNGFYVYFGIQEGLKAIITDEYTESTISLLFNIDGLPLYHGSSEQFWINSGLVLHNQYECQPFIVAACSGNLKPQSVDEFLQNFVTEASYLVQNVATIGQREFK
ncbi:uncharacterized protein LOC112454283, partial [Temnothorax curvispinosus]|uniref:Uncharacterized protein LOC112452639 n=1 Tax=Temnothorax curvispinosus TaxID=300111 RepID=A0A6J1PNQ6_9HYME